jgi:hypothetical protein
VQLSRAGQSHPEPQERTRLPQEAAPVHACVPSVRVDLVLYFAGSNCSETLPP